ncbi:MAG: GNAT family N-acetyltransferase [Planctomycetota bacterium]
MNERAATIATERFELVPFAPEHLLALLESEEAFAIAFGVQPAPGLREFFASVDVSPAWVEDLRAARHADPFVHGFAIVERGSGLAVGTVGFKGRPDPDGVVELAYAVVRSLEGRGIATEAARAATAFALARADVHRVRAHTLPERGASTRVLEKCGFAFAGPVDDHHDGPVWRFERE